MTRRRYGSFTPARRAALRKAQLASAAKRRRNRRIAVGVGSVTVLAATVGAGYIGHRYIQGLKGGPKRPHVPGKELVHVPGHGVTFTRVNLSRRTKRGNYNKPRGSKLFSVDSHGTARRTRFNSNNPQWRVNYNERRHSARGRHLPGTKGVVSTRGSRAAGRKRRKK